MFWAVERVSTGKGTMTMEHEQCRKDRQQLIAICDTKEAEIRALRRAITNARNFAHNNGWTMRTFARLIGVSATQLSEWTSDPITTEPDFKD